MLAQEKTRASDLPPPLESGDILVFLKRNPLPAAVITLRKGKPVFRETPIGLCEAYSLGERYSRRVCESHAQTRVAEHGLRISRIYETEGGKLYVRLV